MNFTTTIEQSADHCKSGTIFLTPSKRQRASSEAESLAPHEPSTAELWKWTLTHEAIAPCFIQDIVKMREHSDPGKEADFFWLGRVPCRTVRIVGLVVGMKEYEKRIVYTVDDGTAVIDCAHRQAPAKKPQANDESHPLHIAKPIAYVGHSVCIMGKVKSQYRTRQILVDQLERCASSNDEPNHWRKVMNLHMSSYSLPGPFVIPPASHQPTSPIKLVPDQPSDANVPSTPSTVSSTPASSAVTSPERSISTQKSPQKLRHPSRLHSRDLTGNTFQLYMKHFMVHAPCADVHQEPEYESDSDDACNLSSSPTKRLRRSLPEETPRASSRPAESTPRPRIPRLLLGTPHELRLSSIPVDPASSMQGFTLSYLRRVPELADMARRVVRAEAKRRLREERKKAKEATSSSGHSHPKSKSTTSQTLDDKERIAPKIKRLFKWAIVRLLQDGSIVLWDGPVRPCRQTAGSYTSGLWKADETASSTIGPDNTIFSATTNEVTNAEEDNEDMEISDPELHEESYIPLSPSYLAGHVARAIGALTKVETKKNAKRIMRPAQSTKEGILAYLRKDDRWRFVGEWNVEEALQVLKRERRAWCIEKGRWELTV